MSEQELVSAKLVSDWRVGTIPGPEGELNAVLRLSMLGIDFTIDYALSPVQTASIVRELQDVIQDQNEWAANDGDD